MHNYCMILFRIAPFIAQILDSYEVTPSKIAQIKVILFAYVNKA